MHSELPPRNVPHNIEAEQALLGAILINNDAYEVVSDFLEVDHFFEPLHGRIYSVLGEFVAKGRVATPVTLKTYFDGEELIDDNLTVPQYLGRLAANATTIINAKEYGRAVHDTSVRRQLILVGEEMITQAFDADINSSAKDQIETAEQSLFELAEHGQADSGQVSFRTALQSTIKRIDNAYVQKGRITGLPTGFADLDRMTGGLMPGNLILLAGRPGSGKTAMATNIAWHVASNGGMPVQFYSLEMTSEELVLRVVSDMTGIDSNLLRRGKISEDQYRDVIYKSRDVQSSPLSIDETGGMSIAKLMARARRAKRQHGTGLIIIDYLQLMAGSGRNKSENETLTEIANGAKAIAKDLHIPVIGLSQLSRGVESRPNKRPMLSDLRSSGSLEQNADQVWFMYREEYYVRQNEPDGGDIIAYDEWERDLARVAGKAELNISKQRHGATGRINLAFDGPTTRFHCLAKEAEYKNRGDNM